MFQYEAFVNPWMISTWLARNSAQGTLAPRGRVQGHGIYHNDIKVVRECLYAFGLMDVWTRRHVGALPLFSGATLVTDPSQ